MSGTFTGSRGAPGGPWLTLHWEQIQVDVANNRSLVRLTLRVHADSDMYFSSSKTGVLQGNSFTFTGGFSGTGSKIVKQLDIWVAHNPDGTKSVTFSGSFAIGVNWGGTQIDNLSVSGTATLPTIPRNGQISLSSTAFDMGTNITIYTGKTAPSHRHTIILQFGNINQTIATNVDESYVWSVPLSLAYEIPNSNAGLGTLICQTYDNGTYIGQSAIQFTTYVPSSVVPTITNFGTWIYGGGRDSVINRYVQGITRVSAEFTPNGSYGSTITSRKIIIRKRVGGGNQQIINSNSGTTPNPVSLSGEYEAVAEVTDSRGRTATRIIYFQVQAYFQPTIYLFSVKRRNSPSTTVDVDAWGEWQNMGTLNPANVSIVRRDVNDNQVTLYNVTGSTTGWVDLLTSYANQSDGSSFSYTLTITDSFGKTASSTVQVGTAFVEFSIAKGKGVGIGKVHQRGALDVQGDIYQNDVKLDERIIDLVYPVGSIYITVNTTSPAVLFGGSWTRFGAGRTLVGYNANDSDFNSHEKTGGSKTHRLSLSEMPVHSHVTHQNLMNISGSGTTYTAKIAQGSEPYYGFGAGTQYSTTSAGGSSGTTQPHNNMQPYITVYMWKRIA